LLIAYFPGPWRWREPLVAAGLASGTYPHRVLHASATSGESSQALSRQQLRDWLARGALRQERGLARREPFASESSRGRLCSRPLSHHRTCFIASGGSPRTRHDCRISASSLGYFLASAGEDSALWPSPSSFTAFAQPVVTPFGAFCLHRLSREPLKFLPSSTFGPSRCRHIGTMTSADSCRLSPTLRLDLQPEGRVAAGLPR